MKCAFKVRFTGKFGREQKSETVPFEERMNGGGKGMLEDFSLRYLVLEASQAAFEECTWRGESQG